MAKVYVITCGEYSDYHICAVCSTRERAEELRPLYSDRYDIAEIEEFEMDQGPANAESRIAVYMVDINRWVEQGVVTDSKLQKIGLSSEHVHLITMDRERDRDKYTFPGFMNYWPKSCDRKSGSLDFKVYIRADVAESEEKALKIARDRFAKALAEQLGV